MCRGRRARGAILERREGDLDLRPAHVAGSRLSRGVSGHDQGRREQARARQSPRGRELRRWGSLPGRLGLGIVTGGAALGTLATVLTGREPGPVLGVFLIAATVAGALAVRRRAAYLIIPVPALAYVVAATAAGLMQNQAAGTSRAMLAVSEVQWFASGFLTVTAATVLAIAIALARWRIRALARWRTRGTADRVPASGSSGTPPG